MKDLRVLLALIVAIIPVAAFAVNEEAPQDPLTKIFGEGGMDLKCDRMDSELNAETGELNRMHIRGNVDIKSELMNLDCDDLVIDMETQIMNATGKLVRFVQEGINGDCGELTYNIETGKIVLEGKPKPFILQENPNGSITRTTANIITMTESGKGRSVNLEGDIEVEVVPAPKSKTDVSSNDSKDEKDAMEKEKKPVKIDTVVGLRKMRRPSVDG